MIRPHPQITVSFLLALFLIAPAHADFSFVHTTGAPVSTAGAYPETATLTPKPAFVIDTASPAIATQETGTSVVAGKNLPVYRLAGLSTAKRAPVSWSQRIFPRDANRIVHFVLLDNSLPGRSFGTFDRSTIDWLKADLESLARPNVDPRGANTPVVIGMPLPIGVPGANVGGVQEFLAAIAPYNVRMILTGGSSDSVWTVNGVPVVTTRGYAHGSYHVIDVTADKAVLAKNRFRVQRAETGGRTPLTEVFSLSLLRPGALPWTASVSLRPAANHVTVVRQPGMNPETTFAYRVNEGPYQPLQSDAEGWSAPLDPTQFIAGENVVTVKATVPDTAEPKFGRGFEYLLPVTVTVAGSGAAVAPTWTAPLGEGVTSGVSREGTTLYAATLAGDVVAVDETNGTTRWRVPLGAAVYGRTPAVNGRVFAAAADGSLYALDAAQGTQVWKAALGTPLIQSPAIAGGVVSVTAADGKVYGLDAANGSTLWSVPGGGVNAPLAAGEDRFFVAGADGVVKALGARTGETLWTVGQATGGGPAEASWIAAAAGRVFASTARGRLEAFSAASGERLWQIQEEVAVAMPVVAGESVYTASEGGAVIALDPANGNVRWRTFTGADIYVAPVAVSGDRVVAASSDGVVTVLQAQDGRSLWRYRVGPGYVVTPAAVSADRLYIAQMNGLITALPLAARASTANR